MSEIYINVNNEDADITNADLISSGDIDTVEVHFSFSEQWDEFPVKTMCVHAITQDEENKIGTNFIGITSEGLSVIPQGALTKPGRLFISVVGENPNGKVLTSTWVTLKIRRGADFIVEDDDVDVLGRLMPAGGNEGDILVKKSDENFDYAWKPSSESLEAGLNISIIDQVISSNCFREVEELPEEGIAGVIYILDNTETPDVEGVFTWDATTEQYISFGKSYTAGTNIQISEQGVISATDTTYTAGDGIDITSEVISASEPKVLNIEISNSRTDTYNSDSALSNAIGIDFNDLEYVYQTKRLEKITIHPHEVESSSEDRNQECSILDIDYSETFIEDEDHSYTTETYEVIFNYVSDDLTSLVNIYAVKVTKFLTDNTLTKYTVEIELKPYTNDIYALRKYYGNENINLGNTNGVPANTYGANSKWNEAIGTGNEITGSNNIVNGTNNNVNGGNNTIIGVGLYATGNFNVAFGAVMPEAKKLGGMANIVTAFGNDVQGNYNAVFGNNNKTRGESHLVAGHNHDVQGYNNLVTGEYNTVNGTDNAVFGIGYGTIQGDSNIVNGYYTYVKPYNGSYSSRNIIGGSYHTVSGSNNLVIGEETSNASFTFPDDEEATTFDHVYGYDNIYSGFLSSISGRYNILTAEYSKILGNQNLVMGDHNAVKGNNNILTGSGGDGGFVGSNNIAVLGGYGTVANGVDFSNIITGYTTAENLRYAALHTFNSHFQNAQYLSAFGHGLKFSGTLDENDHYINPTGLTIIGQWNEDGNNRNDYVFVIGNGEDDSHRNNAFTISTDGQVTCTINDKKHTIFGSSCITDTLPQVGQEDTLYVLIEEEGTETSEITDDAVNVVGMYVWYDGAFVSISTGGGSSYIAGDNISITGNVISANIIEPIAKFTLTPTGTSPTYTVTCDTAFTEMLSRYNSNKLKAELDVVSNVGHNVINMTRFNYQNGVAKFYFEYTVDEYLYVYELTKIGAVDADTYDYDISTTRVQPKLTAGSNITIDSNNVISASGDSSLIAGSGIEININNEICADNIHMVYSLPPTSDLNELYAVPIDDGMYKNVYHLPQAFQNGIDFETWASTGRASIFALTDSRYTYILFFQMRFSDIENEYLEINGNWNNIEVYIYDSENEEWNNVTQNYYFPYPSDGELLIATDQDGNSNSYIIDDYVIKTNISGLTALCPEIGLVWVNKGGYYYPNGKSQHSIAFDATNVPFEIWNPPTRSLQLYYYSSRGYEQLTNGSSSGGTIYTAGNGLELNGTAFSVKTPNNSGITVNNNGVSIDTTVIQTKLTAGNNITISNGTISATDTTYTAGTGISIANGVISLNLAQAEGGGF